MARTMYDKPVRLLLHDMVKAFDLKPGQVFTTTRALTWFKENYPRLQPNGIRRHLVLSATNDKGRLHHHLRADGNDDLLFKIDTGQFRLYEDGKDPAPIYPFAPGDIENEEEINAGEEEDEGDPPAGSTEFLLERDLQLYLSRNLDRIEPDLKLYEEDGVKGLEFDAGAGRRIDILAVDKTGAPVVLELKVSKAYDRVVGQLLRYVNWVRLNIAEPGQRVRGMIVCRTMSEDLRLACAGLEDVELLEYQLSVTVTRLKSMLHQSN